LHPRPVETSKVSLRADIMPLFPLNTVLFPGMWLSLHVFEERYRRLLEYCQQHESPFGVALIRAGVEVGGNCDPYRVGTLARIIKIRPHQDTFFLETQGTRRFRMLRLLRDKPYLECEVEFLPELVAERCEATSRLVDEVFETFCQYLTMIRRLGGQSVDLQHAVLEPEVLSWVIASTLMVSPPIRQQLLEIDDPRIRLERERDLLGQMLRILEQRAQREPQTRHLPFSLN
jgi:uncharacterized protein